MRDKGTKRSFYISKIRELLLQGESKYEIKKGLVNGEYLWMERGDKVKENDVRGYMKEAEESCKFELESSRDAQKALHLERYLALYRECLQNNDRTNARAILDSIAKLTGLNEKEQLEITATSYRLKLV